MARRGFLRGVVGAGAVGVGMYAYGREIGVHALVVERAEVGVRGSAAGLEGKRVVVMSDFHAGPRVSMDYLKRAVGVAMGLSPEYVVLPGGFVDSTLSHLEPLCRVLEPLTKVARVYGSTGNHDFARDRRAEGFSGQVCVPGWGPLVLPVYHRERVSGMYHLEAERPEKGLYVTRGVGHLMKLRLFCPPEVTCLTLRGDGK